MNIFPWHLIVPTASPNYFMMSEPSSPLDERDNDDLFLEEYVELDEYEDNEDGEELDRAASRKTAVDYETELLKDNWTPIHIAASRYRLQSLQALLESNDYDVNAVTNEENKTALHYAVEYSEDNDKKTDTIQLLIANGADLNAHDCVGATPLHYAAKFNCLDTVKALIDNGADVNVGNTEPERQLKYVKSGCTCGDQHALQETCAHLTGETYQSRVSSKRETYRADVTPLHEAAKAGHFEMVRLLIQFGADIIAFDFDDGTPLHSGILGSSVEICKMLLEHEGGTTALTIKQRQGFLPIHNAGISSPDVLKLLLKYCQEADVTVDQEDSWAHGTTALNEACERRNGTEENVRILLEAGANPDKPTRRGMTPLWTAVYSGNAKAVKLMLNAGADAASLAASKVPPLFAAARRGHGGICKVLIQAGCDANQRSNDGDKFAPLHYAAAYGGDEETVRILVEAGADIDAPGSDGCRPIHMACFQGKFRCVKELLSLGADAECADQNSWTPLHFAARYGHLEVVKLLLVACGGNKHSLERTTSRGPGLKSPAQYTAAALAKIYGHANITQLLMEPSGTIGRIND